MLNKTQNEEEFYAKLKLSLEEYGDWPSLYMFKFIVLNDVKKVTLLEALFGEEAEISLRDSKSGKYVSVTAKEIMISPSEVISKYKQAGEIEGVIML